jgi:PilZ domain
MSTSAYAKTRRFARVEESLPVRLRVIEADEAAELARFITTHPTYEEHIPTAPPVPGEGDSWERAAFATILSRIERLEEVVGRIAGAVGVRDEGQPEWITAETVKLSGGGMALRVSSKIDEDDALEMELHLPGAPAATIRALGRVVYVKQPDGDMLPVGRRHVGIAFTAIHDSDREVLVRYTFRVQRAQLRERRSDRRP